MIYTVTLNPSIDYIVDVNEFTLGEVNRTTHELVFPGGKGINVSIVLNHLGIDNTAYGFVAGFTGREIEQRLTAQGIKTDFIKVSNGMSRLNLTVRNVRGTSVNGMGPDITKDDMTKLMDKIKQIKSGDTLVLAGSIPKSVPDMVYADIMKELNKCDIKIVVDATKECLTNVLCFHPFLIKPNHHELGEIFGVKLDPVKDRKEIISYARKLQEMGAVNVLVSMAGDGAVLLDENGCVHTCKALEGKTVNSLGAGDSMVAGFLAGWQKYGDYKKALWMGAAAGSASAFSEGLADYELTCALYDEFSLNFNS